MYFSFYLEMVEESKIESIKRDKSCYRENNQAELTSKKEYYRNALSVAKEAEALAESRANDEAIVELENRIKEYEEREAMLVYCASIWIWLVLFLD
uniref:Uncharacterized protein n=1 Tax=Helianthus annuus TaxID=4232 RepID=A0A251U9D1_HELAN